MNKGAVIGLSVVGVGAAAGGAWLLFGKQLASAAASASAAVAGCGTGTAAGGIPATLNPNYTAQTFVGGPAPGPSGQHEFACLWAVAPQQLPVSGYMGGAPITRPNGQVWVVIATDMTVTGTYNGQPAANAGPWVGIAEYNNGTLVRVYPQPANAFGGALANLGDWSGGY